MKDKDTLGKNKGHTATLAVALQNTISNTSFSVSILHQVLPGIKPAPLIVILDDMPRDTRCGDTDDTVGIVP
jgi:hypothetical protein